MSLQYLQQEILQVGYYETWYFHSSTENKRWDGSQESNLPLDASHVAFPT